MGKFSRDGNDHPLNQDGMNSRKGSGSDGPYSGSPGNNDGYDGDRKGSKLSKPGQGGYGSPDDANYRKGSGKNNPFNAGPNDPYNNGDSSFGPDASRRSSAFNGPNSGRNNNEDSRYYDNFGPNSRKGSNLYDEGNGNAASPYGDARKQSGKPFERGSSRDNLGDHAKYPPLELQNIPLPRTGGNVSADIKKPSYRKSSSDMGSRKGSRLSESGSGPMDGGHGPDGQRKGSYGNDTPQRNISRDNGSPYGNMYGGSGPNSRKGSGADGRGFGPDSRKGSGADARGYGPDSRKGSGSMYPDSESRKGSNSDGKGYGPNHHKLSNTSSMGGGDTYRKGSDSDSRQNGPDSRKSSDLYGCDGNKNLEGLDHPILTDNGNGSVGVFYQ